MTPHTKELMRQHCRKIATSKKIMGYFHICHCANFGQQKKKSSHPKKEPVKTAHHQNRHRQILFAKRTVLISTIFHIEMYSAIKPLGHLGTASATFSMSRRLAFRNNDLPRIDIVDEILQSGNSYSRHLGDRSHSQSASDLCMAFSVFLLAPNTTKDRRKKTSDRKRKSMKRRNQRYSSLL